MKWQWNKISALAGVASAILTMIGIIVALKPIWFSEQPAKENLPIRISPSSYDVSQSSWKPYGPFYEAKSDLYARYGVTHAHAYGNSIGRFVYRVDIGSLEGAHAELRARLSADAIGYSDPVDKYSDVTLTINDTPFPIQRVMPDDGHGGYYTWQFDAKLLQRGTIEFAVEQNAQFRMGSVFTVAPSRLDIPMSGSRSKSNRYT